MSNEIILTLGIDFEKADVNHTRSFLKKIDVAGTRYAELIQMGTDVRSPIKTAGLFSGSNETILIIENLGEERLVIYYSTIPIIYVYQSEVALLRPNVNLLVSGESLMRLLWIDE